MISFPAINILLNKSKLSLCSLEVALSAYLGTLGRSDTDVFLPDRVGQPTGPPGPAPPAAPHTQSVGAYPQSFISPSSTSLHNFTGSCCSANFLLPLFNRNLLWLCRSHKEDKPQRRCVSFLI